MNVSNMTKKDFKNLPVITDTSEITASHLVIIPTNRRNSSGWRNFDLVVCNHDDAIGIIHSCSDVVWLDGISGLDYKANARAPHWRMDILPCGYIRLFANRPITFGPYLGSDAEVFCK